MTDWDIHERRILDAIHSLERKVDSMAVSVEEVLATLTTLTTDLEADAAAAVEEFGKLAKEIEAKAPEVDLEPLKTAVEALDTRVKAAAGSIPTE